MENNDEMKNTTPFQLGLNNINIMDEEDSGYSNQADNEEDEPSLPSYYDQEEE